MSLFSRYILRSLGMAIIGFSSLGVLNAENKGDLPTPKSWAAFQESDYGATLYYPSNWFVKSETKDGYVIFSSLNDKSSLSFRTYLDPARTGAAETVSKIKSGTGSHRILHLKQGEMWYEILLNGANPPAVNEKSGMLVFSRTIYSCKERVVSQISLTYPASSAKSYEAMLKKMVRRFQQGVGSKTPVRQCS